MALSGPMVVGDIHPFDYQIRIGVLHGGNPSHNGRNRPGGKNRNRYRSAAMGIFISLHKHLLEAEIPGELFEIIFNHQKAQSKGFHRMDQPGLMSIHVQDSILIGPYIAQVHLKGAQFPRRDWTWSTR
jgi:hypothetical protein